jgi:hypothetical protein
VLRLGTEPVLFAYYMAVPIVLVVTADLVGHRHWRRDVLVGAATSALFMTQAMSPALWWLAFGAGVLILAREPLRVVVRGTTTQAGVPTPAFA